MCGPRAPAAEGKESGGVVREPWDRAGGCHGGTRGVLGAVGEAPGPLSLGELAGNLAALLLQGLVGGFLGSRFVWCW